MCPSYVMEELAYWEISEHSLAKCCWYWFNAHQMEYKMRDNIERIFTGHLRSRQKWRTGNWRRKMYLFLQDPRSSTGAKVGICKPRLLFNSHWGFNDCGFKYCEQLWRLNTLKLKSQYLLFGNGLFCALGRSPMLKPFLTDYDHHGP